MIKIENVVTPSPEQWLAIIRGCRNPLNSWERMDSKQKFESSHDLSGGYIEIGPNDLDLMMRLRKAGSPDHRKFMRMIVVYANITAPMYWFSEYDTYKIGTVANSTSKMHKLLAKPFEISDFSFDKLLGYETNISPIINALNALRDAYLKEPDEEKKKQTWYVILQLLPSSYNQRRTVMLNYEVLANIYHSRKNHKLDEWREFCKWIETLPYSELITLKESTK